MKNFDGLKNSLRVNKDIKTVAVVAAADMHTLEAVLMAQKDGMVEPVLIGDSVKIKECIDALEFKGEVEILEETDGEKAAYKAIELVNTNKADFIMKGKVETKTLMKAIVKKESNMRTGRVMSHIAFLEIPTYHKLLALTDVAMNTEPDANQKRQIVENAVEAMNKMGIENPKVGVLAAAEEVNTKIKDSTDAEEINNMGTNGIIKGCVIEGPISYDLAVDKESVEIKKYESPVGGDADLLVVPNLTAGNILIKALTFSGKAKSAGFIVGAKVPVVVTSRASTTEDKYMSLVLAASAS